MSKFDEMCATYATARKEWFAYRDRCFRHLGILVSGFIQDCEIPSTYISFVPLSDESKDESLENRQFSLLGATHFDDDGYWQVGLRITLVEAPNTYPQMRVLVPLCVREDSGNVVVRLGTDGVPTRINIDNKDECRKIYDCIVERVQRLFTSGLQQSLQTPELSKTIGFAPDR